MQLLLPTSYSFDQSVSDRAGTVTYEDVTSVDSVGIIMPHY